MPPIPVGNSDAYNEWFHRKYGDLTPIEKAFAEIGVKQGEPLGAGRTLRALSGFDPSASTWENLKSVAITQPWENTKALGNFGWNALKGFAGQASNAVQALNPTPWNVPGATDPLQEVPLTAGGVLGNTAYRLQRLGNAALFGLPDAMQQRVDKAYDEYAFAHREQVGTNSSGEPILQGKQPDTLDEHLLTYGKGVVSSVANDIFGWENVRQLLRGEKEVGLEKAGYDDTGKPIFRPKYEPLTTQDAIDEAGSLAMKWSIVGRSPWLRGSGPNGGLSGVVFGKKNLPTNKVVTAGELEAARVAELLPKSKAPGGAEAVGEPAPPVKAYDALTPEAQALFNLDDTTFSRQQLHSIIGKVVNTEAYRKIAANSSDLVFKNIGETIRSGGGLTDEQVGRFIKDQGLLPTQMRDLLADAFEQTVSKAGVKLYEVSEAANRFAEAQLTMDATAGNMNAKAALKKVLQKRLGELDAYHQWVNTINNAIEGPRRALMVTQLATTMRNIRSQGLTAVNQMLGHIVSGTFEKLTGKVGGNPGAAYGDLISDITVAIDRFSPAQRRLLEDTLNQLPLIKNHIRGGSMFDLQQTLLHNEALRGLPEVNHGVRGKISSGLDHLSYWLNTFNRMQEYQFRNYFFQQRLEANLKARGWSYGQEGAIGHGPEGEIQLHTAPKKSILQQVNEAVKDPEYAPTPEFREAIAEAAEHALQQTFAADFGSSLMGATLKVYRQLPGLTTVLPPYPRFLANQWRWQMERSPVNWFDLFDKDFRKGLMDGAADGFKSRQAARHLGKAMEGTLLLNAAWALQNSDAAGPKYYQMRTGPLLPDKNEKGETIYQDWRDTQPFVTYLGMAHVAKSLINNTPINMSIDEWGDFVAGVRRLSDYPAFAIGEYLRNLKTENPSTFVTNWSKPLGSWLGSWFTFPRGLNEAYGGLEQMVTGEPSKNLEYPNTQVQPIFGQAKGNAVPSTMPARPNPFTGNPQRSEYPLTRQFAGTTLNSQTKFQELVLSTPGLQLGRLLGDHGSPEADTLIHAEIGKILNTKLEEGSRKGELVGDVLAETIKSLNLAPKMQAAVINEIYHGEGGLGQQAKDQVLAVLKPEDLPHFYEMFLASVPAVARGVVRAKLQELPLPRSQP